MSSNEPNTDELKAGHPPAIKAGGMRITSKVHHVHQNPPPATPSEKEEEEELEETAAKEREGQSRLVVSGVLTKGNADFPPQAVKVAHEKPLPLHEKRPAGHSGPRTKGQIMQPRK